MQLKWLRSDRGDIGIILLVSLGLLLLLMMIVPNDKTSIEQERAQQISQVNKVLDTWIGTSLDSVYERLGPPSQVLDGSDGDKIITYIKTYSEITGTSALGTYVATTNSHKAYIMFWISKANKVYKYSWNVE